MTKQSVGEIVDDLVARGYAKRIPDPADRRAKLICLTERGREAQAPRLRPLRQGRSALGGPPRRASEIERLRATLEEIAANEAPDAVPELERPELANV